MKSLVVYYSHSGNTGRIARRFIDALREKGRTDIFELRYNIRRRDPISQFLYRLYPLRFKLGKAVPLNLENYDLLCIGVPVWEGRPAPPVEAYIKGCRNACGKKIICFMTYGAKGTDQECLDYIKKILNKKGSPEIIPVSIFWRDARDDEVVSKCVEEAVANI